MLRFFSKGFFWRQFMTETGAEPEAWEFLAVCVPVVVFFGPFGSFLSSHFHRQVLAMFIYILDTLALVRPACLYKGKFCWNYHLPISILILKVPIYFEFALAKHAYVVVVFVLSYLY